MTKLTLICGDALRILPKLEDESVDLILTDPPYNCGKKKFGIKEKSYKRISEDWDTYTKEEYKELMIAIFQEYYRTMKKGASLLITGMFHNAFDTHIWLRDELNFTFRNFITWFKSDAMPIQFAKQIGCYAYSCEYINYFIKGKRTKTFNYDLAKSLNHERQQRDLLNLKVYSDIKSKIENHPAQKPSDLWNYLIKIHSRENDLILDSFIGSGTTLKSCLELNRTCIGIEKEKKYIDMTKKRLNWGSSLNPEIEFEYIDYSKL